ncbi:MAG: outer membrane beta-barrel protein [Rhodovibrionaceae bacterium]|nr:outer membrane beta-barrel protein [Rhodovibrionaceae bacterium]
MVRKLLLAATGLCMLSGPAVAKDGPYVGLGGGVNWLSDADVEGTSAEFEFDAGFAVLGTLGYAFAEPWMVGDVRAELEISYRENNFDSISGGGRSFDLDGDASQLFGMANVLFDIDTGSRFTPYVGAGVGIGQLWVDDLTLSRFPGLGSVDDSDTVFGFQTIAGIAFDVTPQISLTADYRFLITEDPEFDGVDTENRNHTLMFGARYHL